MITTGTIIFAMRSDNEVILAADSMVSPINEDCPPNLRCKIKIVRNIYFAIAGIHHCNDAGFDSYRITTRVVAKHRSIDKAIRKLAKDMRGPLLNTLKYIRGKWPERFAEHYANNRAVSIALIAIKRGNPVLGVMVFWSMIENEEIKLKIQYHYMETGPQVCVLGRHNALSPLPTNEQFLQNPVKTILELTHRQVKADAAQNIKHIDWPIYIYRITPKSEEYMKQETPDSTIIVSRP